MLFQINGYQIEYSSQSNNYLLIDVTKPKEKYLPEIGEGRNTLPYFRDFLATRT